jgi:long-chain acyl-CoA synthetase
MNYTSKDLNQQGQHVPRGEICMKGPTIFKGYYKNAEKTAEALDAEGWLHTGDVGAILPNGALKIIDRKKNIFKLSQGEYIAPDKIEGVYGLSELIAEVFIHGDSLQNYVVGIIVPQKNALEKLAEGINIKGTFEELCQNEKVREEVQKKLASLGSSKGLNSLEIAKKIWLVPEPFASKELLTTTMKVKRHEARKAFEKEIKEMYATGG